MKCMHCHGTGYIELPFNDSLDDCIDECDKCNGSGEVLTEQEYIQTATTWQLVKWLVEHMDCASCCCKTLCHQGHDCKLALIKWLKQPHTSKE